MMATPKLYSVAPTRSSGNGGLTTERRVLVFTSDWHFKPAGVEFLHAQLKSLLDVPFLYRWDEATASFIVECMSGNTDKIALKFLQVHQGIIKMECARNNSNSDDDSSDADSDTGSDVSGGWEDKRAVSSDKIMLASEWKRKKLPETPRDESTLSTQPQAVAGPQVPSYQFPRTYHIFLGEGVVDFQIILRKILDVKKRHYETTLLDNIPTTPYDFVYMFNGSPLDNNALSQAIVARSTIIDHKRNLYIAVKEPKLKSASKEEDIALLHRDWADFVYQKQGSFDPLLRTKAPPPKPAPVLRTPEPTLPLPQVQPTAIKPASVIDKWAAELPKTRVNPQTIPALKSFAPPAQKPKWDTYQSYGDNVQTIVHKVESQVLLNRRAVSASEASTLPSQKVAGPPQQQQQVRVASQGQTPSQAQTSQGRRTPPHLRAWNPPLQASQALQSSQSSRPSQPSRPVQTAQSSRPSQSSQSHRSSSYNFMDDDASVINYPSLMDSIPVPASSARRVQSSANLITFDEPAVAIQQSSSSIQDLADMFETQQLDDEVSTRKFRNTMNQKAPNPGRGRQDKSSSFADSLPLPSPPRQKPKASSTKQVPFPEVASAAQDFVEILDMIKASGFQGKIRFQVDFGRILLRSIPKQFVALKDSSKSYKRDFLSENVIAHSPQSTFTKVLTTVAQDVHFVVDLKDENENRMWESKPFAWSVVYEFRCVSNMTREVFTVKMDGETMECSVTTEVNLGNIFVHGIKRRWDIRLLINGTIDLSEHYTEYANAIKKSMFIPANSTSPDLRFEFSLDMMQKYSLHALRVHRTTKFRNKLENGPVLNVLEIQDLMLQFRDVAVPDLPKMTIYKASAKNPPNLLPQEKLDMWYEVSITSPQIDEKLKDPAWTSATIQSLNGTDQVLQPACLMLQKMDGVGFHNSNGVTDVRPAREPSPPPPEPEQFW